MIAWAVCTIATIGRPSLSDGLSAPSLYLYIDLRRLFEVSGSGSALFRPEGTCPLSAASWNVGSKFTLEHARIPPLSADDISARHKEGFVLEVLMWPWSELGFVGFWDHGFGSLQRYLLGSYAKRPYIQY